MELTLNRLLFCTVLFLFIAGTGFSEETIHVIKQGETIYSLARTYGVSAQDILTHNKISDARTVQVGAKIRIPGTAAVGSSSATPVSQPSGARAYDEYRVEKNDTLYSLARRYGINVAELLDMNGFAPNYVIKAGEKIRVPALASNQQQNKAGNGLKNDTSAPSTGNTAPVAGTSGTVGGTSAPSTGTSGTAATVVKVDPAVKWPIKAKEIAYITGKLNGVQITGERQEGVKSLTGGTVVSAGPYRGFGKVAIVQTPGGYLYVYGGCETLSVKEGDKVVSGTELGKLGIDTKSAKSQLFFFVYRGNTSVDPTKAPRA